MIDPHPSYPRLHHEELDVYQAAIEFLALAARVISGLPRGYGYLAEQLKTASLSIPLNVAEGYGKRSKSDRTRSYDIARGSAHECGAIVDACKVLEVIEHSHLAEGKTLLHRIISMLVKMTS